MPGETDRATLEIPHGTSQNLRKKVPGHVNLVLGRHCLSYDIDHFHLPTQGGGIHTDWSTQKYTDT